MLKLHWRWWCRRRGRGGCWRMTRPQAELGVRGVGTRSNTKQTACKVLDTITLTNSNLLSSINSFSEVRFIESVTINRIPSRFEPYESSTFCVCSNWYVRLLKVHLSIYVYFIYLIKPQQRATKYLYVLYFFLKNIQTR